MKKRWLFWVLWVWVLLVLPLCTAARAEGEVLTDSMTLEEAASVPMTLSAMASPEAGKYDAVAQRIRNAASALEYEVNIKDLGIPHTDSYKPIFDMYFGTQEDYPELLLADSVSITYSNQKVETVKLTYIANPGQMGSMRKNYEAAVKRALDSVPASCSTPLEKALYLHDYLVLHTVYSSGSGYSQVQHSAYGALVNGNAVCSGYARAYKDMLTRLGIPSRYVRSDAMNHAWNMVSINGTWFEVDITWDDPVVDTFGPDQDITNRVNHDYFMVSTSQMRALHNGGRDAVSYSRDALPLCISTQYQGYAFRDAVSSMYKKGERWYYLTPYGSLVSNRLDGMDEKTVLEIWGSPVLGYFANGRFYYAEGSQLRSINLDGTGDTLYYTYPSGWRIEEFSVTADRFMLGVVYNGSYQKQYHLLCDVEYGTPGASGWVQTGSGWQYQSQGQALTGWQKVDGRWYYMDGQGMMQAAQWLQDGSKWYYLGADGAMKASQWLQSGGMWYYVGSSGAMLASQWLQNGGKWYYLGTGGAMLASQWLQSGGKWYYLGADGAMLASQWLQSGGKWYYLDASGCMLASGTYLVGGKAYSFDASGVMK